jgi:hypothetical protein
MLGWLMNPVRVGGQRRHRRQLQLEALERRETPAIYTVTNSSDNIFAIPVTLRQAIAASQTTVGPDTIQFGPGAFDANGNCVIQLDAPLPTITEQLEILGFVEGKNRPIIRPAPNANGGLPFRIFDVNIPLAQKGAPCSSATSRSRAGKLRTPLMVTEAESGR